MTFFLVFTRFRGRKDKISTKVLSHSECVWSRLQKRPPQVKFFCISTRVFNLIANVNKQLIAYFGQTQLIAIL